MIRHAVALAHFLRRPIALLTGVAALLGSAHAFAFDQVVHHSLVYAAAVANGVSPQEASIIANGAYSLDENDSTTAFSMSLIPVELQAAFKQLPPGPQLPDNILTQTPKLLENLEKELRELPHMRSGQIFHALTSPQNRKLVQLAHVARINRVLNHPDEPGTPEQKRHRALLYLGQYLHFVGDTVVHPNEPLLGHALKGHLPDRGDLNLPAVLQALNLFSREINELNRVSSSGRLGLSGSGENLFRVQWLPGSADEAAKRPLPARIANSDLGHQALIQVARTVSDSWAKTYADENICNLLIGKTFSEEAIGDMLLRERTARAASEVNRVLASRLPQADVHRSGIFRKIVLSADGEPLASCMQPPAGDCRSDIAESTFGKLDISILPFSRAADSPELQVERERMLGLIKGQVLQIPSAVVLGIKDMWPDFIRRRVCGAAEWVGKVLIEPPAKAAQRDIAELRMAAASVVTTVNQAARQEVQAQERLVAAARTQNPEHRRQKEAEARQALNTRDGLLVSVAQQTGVPLPSSQRQGSALRFGRSPTLELLRKMDQQYKEEGKGNPLGTFIENYDGAAKRTAEDLNRNSGTRFFGIPSAARAVPGSSPASPGPAKSELPPKVSAAPAREPGGIKFSSSRAADISATIDVSSIAFDAARGKIVVSGGKAGEITFDLDMFADVLRLAVEEYEPFFSLDAVDSEAWDGRGRRILDELDKKYPSTTDLIQAVQRVSPPPVVRGSRQYFYTTVDALDPELTLRADAGRNVATTLVFSPAWLRYSKVGQVLYEADLAIKAVAAGFVERDGAIAAVPEVWKIPDYDPIWLRPGDGTAGRANFELSRAKVTREAGRVDLSEIHPELYVTRRKPGTTQDLPPSARDRALSEHFSKHWRAYADAVPEIGRLVMVFRAYVAARFLIDNHPGLKARILSFPRELPPEQPPILTIDPRVIRVAIENGQPVSLVPGVENWLSLSGGYGGGIVFGVSKTDGDQRRIVVVNRDTPPAGDFWRGLFAATWYDASVAQIESPGANALVLDFEGGDMRLSWHLRLIAMAGGLGLIATAVALLLRRFDWQCIEVADTCAHCGRVHASAGRVASAADMAAIASLIYLVALPLAASPSEAGTDWRELALGTSMVVVLLLVLILFGLFLRYATLLMRPTALQSAGWAAALCAGARVTSLLVAAFLFQQGIDASAVGRVVGQVLTPPVAEQLFATLGNTTPITLAVAVGGGAALVSLACRWLVPLMLGSRPLVLFSSTTHVHAQPS